MVNLNAQRISKNEYVVLFPYGPGKATKFGLLYNARSGKFKIVNGLQGLTGRELNDIKQLVKANLPDKIEKSFEVKLNHRNYIVIYETDASVILYSIKDNYWAKFTPEFYDKVPCGDGNWIPPYSICTKIIEEWDLIEFGGGCDAVCDPFSQPFNGNWCLWDNN